MSDIYIFNNIYLFKLFSYIQIYHKLFHCIETVIINQDPLTGFVASIYAIA